MTVEPSLPVLTTYTCRDLESNPYFLHTKQTFYQLNHRDFSLSILTLNVKFNCYSYAWFVCFGVFVSRIFHSYGDVNITGERLQILTYGRHLLPLSSEGSFAYPIYCETGHPLYWSSPRTRDTPIAEWLVLSRLGFEHRTFRLQDQRSNPLRHCRGWKS